MRLSMVPIVLVMLCAHFALIDPQARLYFVLPKYGLISRVIGSCRNGRYAHPAISPHGSN